MPFTKLSQVATEKLIQLKEELNTWNKTLNYTKAKRASLSSKAGDYYESLKALALENYNSKTLNQLWLEDLIKLLMGADGLTVNANVDGQFLFNDVAKKESIIFTLRKKEIGLIL